MEFVKLLVGIGDAVIAMLQVCLLGDMGFWVDTLVSNRNDNLGTEDNDPGSWLYANKKDVEALKNGQTTERGSVLVVASEKGLSHGFIHEWKVPNILYSPENIFANKIAALDANYINPHEYTPVNDSAESAREAESFAETISPTIASWYRAFRNIAIVGLLSVLVYIGIRILIGSVSEKAQYKERLQDWFMALCLVFFMHFIMAGIMMISEKITDLFSNAINSGIIVAVDDGTIFRTSLIGYIRFAVQSNSWTEAVANSFMYFILIGITIRFTYIYLKRALYLAFFTMISPLVAITYPIDRAGDGQAQAFNTWIKEYFINAIIQPIHLVIYSSLVGAAITLVVQNPIYGIVVLLFISTAEKWVKAMFKMDQAKLTSTSLTDVAALGTVFNAGKNLVSGTVKTAALVGATIATGGVAAPGVLAGAAGEAAGAAAGEAAAGAAGAAGEAAGAAAGEAAGAAAGSSTSVLPEGGVEEAVQQRAMIEGNIQRLAESSGDDDDSGLSMPEIRTVDESTINGALSPEEVGLAGDIGEIVSAKLTEEQQGAGATWEPQVTGAQQQQVTGAQQQQITGAQQQQSVGAQQQQITGAQQQQSVGAQQQQGAGPQQQQSTGAQQQQGAGTQQQPSKSEENAKAVIKERLIKSLTDKDPKDELVDMLIKGVTGAITTIPGAALGAFGAGLTGENSALATGVAGGASAGAAAADTVLGMRDTILKHNISILVKEAELTDKDVIQNIAKAGKAHNWSDAKMVQVGKLAKAYPNLAQDQEGRNDIKRILRSQGVVESKLEKAIQDIIDAQTTTASVDKSTQKGINRYQNWR